MLNSENVEFGHDTYGDVGFITNSEEYSLWVEFLYDKL